MSCCGVSVGMDNSNTKQHRQGRPCGVTPPGSRQVVLLLSDEAFDKLASLVVVYKSRSAVVEALLAKIEIDVKVSGLLSATLGEPGA
jgi:hypothetical protein